MRHDSEFVQQAQFAVLMRAVANRSTAVEHESGEPEWTRWQLKFVAPLRCRTQFVDVVLMFCSTGLKLPPCDVQGDFGEVVV